MIPNAYDIRERRLVKADEAVQVWGRYFCVVCHAEVMCHGGIDRSVHFRHKRLANMWCRLRSLNNSDSLARTTSSYQEKRASLPTAHTARTWRGQFLVLAPAAGVGHAPSARLDVVASPGVAARRPPAREVPRPPPRRRPAPVAWMLAAALGLLLFFVCVGSGYLVFRDTPVNPLAPSGPPRRSAFTGRSADAAQSTPITTLLGEAVEWGAQPADISSTLAPHPERRRSCTSAFTRSVIVSPHGAVTQRTQLLFYRDEGLFLVSADLPRPNDMRTILVQLFGEPLDVPHPDLWRSGQTTVQFRPDGDHDELRVYERDRWGRYHAEAAACRRGR